MPPGLEADTLRVPAGQGFFQLLGGSFFADCDPRPAVQGEAADGFPCPAEADDQQFLILEFHLSDLQCCQAE